MNDDISTGNCGGDPVYSNPNCDDLKCRDREGADSYPLAYHITINCYGRKIPGDESGTIHHGDNIYGTPKVPYKPGLKRYHEGHLNQPPYEMDSLRRRVVLKTVLAVCRYRGWQLLAAHVRTNHLHVVVEAMCKPEKVLNDLKAYASRSLNKAGLDGKNRKRWARHGSTTYMWKERDVEDAVNYVIRGQGDFMEYYERG
jgi:REP element-mobilizing transposase RayT